MDWMTKISAGATSLYHDFGELKAVKKVTGFIKDAYARIRNAFHCINPSNLTNPPRKVDVITGDAEVQISFGALINPQEEDQPSPAKKSWIQRVIDYFKTPVNKIVIEQVDLVRAKDGQIVVFHMDKEFDPEELDKKVMENLSPWVKIEEDIDLVLKLLHEVPCENKSVKMDIQPKIGVDPVVYSYSRESLGSLEPSLGPESIPKATVMVPKDLLHRFDSTYCFENEVIQFPAPKEVDNTHENIASFCKILHEKLIERVKAKGGQDLVDAFSEKMPQIIEKILVFACVDGIAGTMFDDDSKSLLFSQEHPLKNKFILAPRIDASKNYFNLAIDDALNLCISLRTFSTLSIIELNRDPDAEEEPMDIDLKSQTLATVRINLMNVDEINSVELTRAPYAPVAV